MLKSVMWTRWHHSNDAEFSLNQRQVNLQLCNVTMNQWAIATGTDWGLQLKRIKFVEIPVLHFGFNDMNKRFSRIDFIYSSNKVCNF